MLAIDVVDGKASLPETPRSNKYILTMGVLITKFGVAASMPEQAAQTVADPLLCRWVFLFGDASRLLTDQ